ncbi:MAG TPA: hypothetical protein VIC03_01570 [Gemmatimonadaceae bacterium]|jgi:hypothetical protein
MSKYIHRARVLFAAPAAIALLALGACGGSKNDSLAQDTTLASDIQLANKDSAAQPQLTDVPATTTPAPAAAARKPVTRTPSTPSRPTTPAKTTTASGNTVTRNTGAKETALGTIAAGSTIALTSDSRVCTNTNQVGQTITGTVAQSVAGSNGATIPAGAKVALEITKLKRSENVKDNIEMDFRVKSVSFGGRTYPVTATVASAQVDRVKNQPSSKDVQKVATGAAVGAIVGQIIGHSTKSTVIGGAVGAAAGAGTAAATSNYEGCVPNGGNITVKLDNSVQVHS